MVQTHRVVIQDTTPPGAVGNEHARPSTVLRVIGEIDLATQETLADAIDAAESRTTGPIILDVSAMGFCGAGGLALIMQATVRAAEHGTHLGLIGLTPRLEMLCSRLWPGPQPVHYPDAATAGFVSAALSDATGNGTTSKGVSVHRASPGDAPSNGSSTRGSARPTDGLTAAIDDARVALRELLARAHIPSRNGR